MKRRGLFFLRAGFALALCFAAKLSVAHAEGARSVASHDVPRARATMGLRNQWWPSDGIAPFRERSVVPMFSLAGDYTVLLSGGPAAGREAPRSGAPGAERYKVPFSVAIGLSWDHSQSHALARGLESSLVVNRFTLPIEGRYHAHRWIFLFGRFAPGFGVQSASVTLDASGTQARDTRVTFASDFSLGASFALSPPQTGSKRAPRRAPVRVWLTPEFGLSLASGGAFALRAAQREGADAPTPGHSDATYLPSFSAWGPFLRFALGMSF